MEMILPIVIIVFSAVLHEVMHGFVADKLGDPTARVMGRLTLNPIPHIDPLSSIIIPALLFIGSGGQFIFASAKPVPVNPIHFEDPKKDMALVALAGPATNLALALIAALLYRMIPATPFLTPLLFGIVLYNLLLAFVNLIPIPPLDGSKILVSFLPSSFARSYLSIEPYGIFILMFLFFMPVGGFSLGGFLNMLLSAALRFLGM